MRSVMIGLLAVAIFFLIVIGVRDGELKKVADNRTAHEYCLRVYPYTEDDLGWSNDIWNCVWRWHDRERMLRKLDYLGIEEE